MIDEKYDKLARLFQIWNIGKYETIYLRQREDKYRIGGAN